MIRGPLEEALTDKQSRYLTQSLGMCDDEMDIHVQRFPLQPHRLLLLCTDGLWNYFPHRGTLTSLIRTPVRADEPADAGAASICQRLIAAANEGGGKDNITAAILAL
jgi:serine/threonine protein phosphatase PrpC